MELRGAQTIESAISEISTGREMEPNEFEIFTRSPFTTPMLAARWAEIWARAGRAVRGGGHPPA